MIQRGQSLKLLFFDGPIPLGFPKDYDGNLSVPVTLISRPRRSYDWYVYDRTSAVTNRALHIQLGYNNMMPLDPFGEPR